MASPNPLFLREEELDRGLELLYFASHQLDLDATPARGRIGIDGTDFRTLFLIDRRPGITLAELCAALGTSKQTLSRHLKRLAGSGLVDQQGTPYDRRKRPLRLTGRSDALLAEIKAAQKRRLRSAFKSAGATAVEGFQRVLLDLAGEARREPWRRPTTGAGAP
jgi:DNA-binding MarR family transcriptional regulator